MHVVVPLGLCGAAPCGDQCGAGWREGCGQGGEEKAVGQPASTQRGEVMAGTGRGCCLGDTKGAWGCAHRTLVGGGDREPVWSFRAQRGRTLSGASLARFPLR